MRREALVEEDMTVPHSSIPTPDSRLPTPKSSILNPQSAILDWKVPVLAYHKIGDNFELGVNSIAARTFERQMCFLAKNRYTTITVDQFLLLCSQNAARITARNRECSERVKLPPRPVLITFDDGYESFYTQAYPILRKYGLTATVFVLGGYIGKLNTWDVRLSLKRPRHLNQAEIRSLAHEGVGIGSHSMHHPFLTCCSSEVIKAEIQESKSLLEELLGRSVDSFSYPYGDASPQISEMVRSAGYRIAFGLNPGHGYISHSMFNFPRMAIYKYDTMRAFETKLGLHGKYGFKFVCRKNKMINRFAYLNRLRFRRK